MSEEVSINPEKIFKSITKAFSGMSRKATTEIPQLPLPDTQNIEERCIVWTWGTTDPNIKIKAFLFKDGEYDVDIHTGSELTNLSPELAFSIGQALQAAGGYRDNWQNFAGQFIADDFFHSGANTEPTKEVEVIESPNFDGVRKIKDNPQA